MTIGKLIDLLSTVAKKCGTDAEIKVEGFDDNFYDGEPIAGVRYNSDLFFNKSEERVFIIKGETE